jgi:O-antigen/teichoic acid export membrane protein
VTAAGQTVSAAGLRGAVVSGLAWKIASQLLGQGSRIAVGLILARLLTPHQFGLAAMALAFSGLAMILSDPALSAALVQRRHITEIDKSTVFWTTVTAGALCTGIGIAIAHPVAAFFGDPAVAPLFAVESLTFLLVALSATQVAVLTREMSFRSLELREMAGTVAGAVVGVALALTGGGAWAIIGQSVAGTAAATVLLWKFSPWRPQATFSQRSLRECGGFGIKLFGSRLLSFVNLNADNLLVGRYLGSAALGIYAIAYNVMFAPLARVAQPVQSVLIPAFARLRDEPQRVGEVWLRGSLLTAVVAVPGFVGMLVVAPDFVPVVLGSRWDAAVPVLQLLCIAGIVQALHMLQWSLLQARGEAGTLLRFNLFSTVVNVTAFAVGLMWGIKGVAAGFAISRVLLLPLFPWLACRSVGMPLRRFFTNLRPVAEAALFMLGAVFGARVLLVHAGVGTAARLVLLVAVGAVAYIGILFVRSRPLLIELRRLREVRP